MDDTSYTAFIRARYLADIRKANHRNKALLKYLDSLPADQLDDEIGLDDLLSRIDSEITLAAEEAEYNISYEE